jgi:hypothetical protein
MFFEQAVQSRMDIFKWRIESDVHKRKVTASLYGHEVLRYTKKSLSTTKNLPLASHLRKLCRDFAESIPLPLLGTVRRGLGRGRRVSV